MQAEWEMRGALRASYSNLAPATVHARTEALARFSNEHFGNTQIPMNRCSAQTKSSQHA